jgi:hypothetical protein
MDGKRLNASTYRSWIIFCALALVLLVGGLVLAMDRLGDEISAFLGAQF